MKNRILGAVIVAYKTRVFVGDREKIKITLSSLK